MTEPLDKVKEDQEILQNDAKENEDAIGSLLEDVDPETGDIEQKPEPEPEVTPEPEVKPTPVGGTPEQKPEEKVEPEDLEAELEKIQPPRKGSSAAEGYAALKERIRKEAGEKLAEKQAREAAERKALELEEKLKTPTVPEEVQNELKELRRIAREQDINNDPEFRQKYTTRLQTYDQEALNLLVEAGMKKETAEWINKRGGLIAMAGSKRLMPDGKQTESEYVEEVILARTPPLYVDRVKKRIIDGLELSQEMGKEIEAAKQEAPQRQERRMKEIQARFESGRDEEIKNLGEVAKKWDIPKDATPEDKARIERHNARLEKAEKAFNEFAQKGSDPREAARMLVQASHSVYWKEAYDEQQVRAEKAERDLADLQARYDRMKSAGTHSRPGAAPIPSSKPQPKPLVKVSDEDALEGYFSEQDKA